MNYLIDNRQICVYFCDMQEHLHKMEEKNGAS